MASKGSNIKVYSLSALTWNRWIWHRAAWLVVMSARTGYSGQFHVPRYVWLIGICLSGQLEREALRIKWSSSSSFLIMVHLVFSCLLSRKRWWVQWWWWHQLESPQVCSKVPGGHCQQQAWSPAGLLQNPLPNLDKQIQREGGECQSWHLQRLYLLAEANAAHPELAACFRCLWQRWRSPDNASEPGGWEDAGLV